MEIRHTVSFNPSSELRVALAHVGVPVGDESFVSVAMTESDPRWPAFIALFQGDPPLDIVSTSFCSDELARAGWVALVREWQYGYPLPENDFREVTYDLTEWCPRCFLGARQKEPFRIKGEPRWGRRHAFELFWTYGEFFVRKDTWEELFQRIGIESWPVHGRSGRELETVVQLKPPSTECRLHLEGRPATKCDICGRLKYRPITRGMLPALKGDPTNAAWRTQEWFGSGGEVGHKTVISAQLLRSMQAYGVRGVRYQPLENDPSTPPADALR